MSSLCECVISCRYKTLGEKKSLPHVSETGRYRISTATLEEASIVADLVTEAFFAAEYFRKKSAKRVTPEEVCQQIKQPEKYQWYVLKEYEENPSNNTVSKVGTILSTILWEAEDNEKASLHMLATRPKVWNQKLGSLLLDEVVNRTTTQNKFVLVLSCVNNKRLIKYYKRHGFKSTGHKGIYDSEYVRPEYVDKITTIDMIYEVNHPKKFTCSIQ